MRLVQRLCSVERFNPFQGKALPPFLLGSAQTRPTRDSAWKVCRTSCSVFGRLGRGAQATSPSSRPKVWIGSGSRRCARDAVKQRGILELADIQGERKPPGDRRCGHPHGAKPEGEVCKRGDAEVMRIVRTVSIGIMPPGSQALVVCQPRIDGVADPLQPNQEEHQPEDYLCARFHSQPSKDYCLPVQRPLLKTSFELPGEVFIQVVCQPTSKPDSLGCPEEANLQSA